MRRCRAAIFSLSAPRTSLTVPACRREVRQAAMRSGRDRGLPRREGRQDGAKEGALLKRAPEGTH